MTLVKKYGLIYGVSERNNNEINKMNNENIETIRAEFKDQFMSDNNTVLVSCCGCGEEVHISQEEADQWTDTDRFQCHECE